MHTYRFFWAPEGRPLCDVVARTRAIARAEFRRHFPTHARYMGELWIEVDPVHYRDLPRYQA